ncbi:MAG: HlyD family efflux transporter periplasmic adaptor subunit [Pirellulales bacterium]|nr:HlyD family efflux transporter periplasmic adaptor subunit [Pirellulales bacterium]
MKLLVRRILTLLVVAALIGFIGYGLLPAPVEVDLAQAERGSIRVTVDQDGKTRIRERYVVSTPLAGRLLRVELDPGDAVEAGKTLLATVEPRDPELLDARAIAQAEARVKAAEAALQKMEPTLEEVRAAQEFSEAELKRVRDARRKSPQAVSASEVESKLLEYRVRTALLRSARHSEEIARFELDQAEAALIRSRPQENGAPVDDDTTENDGWNFLIRSPIDGRVLRVFQESSVFVTGGTALLELGDPTDLEVEIDVLSRDAVNIQPGAQVLLENWGGGKTLQGQVRLVEPSAFTKISTLGVEEQRVNVIVDLVDPPQERKALGDGFRVEARIIVSQASNVLRIPTSALFRIGDDWAVFHVDRGVARETVVQLGMQNGLEAEIRSGLSAGDQVVIHPGDEVVDGTNVTAR